MIKKLFIWVAVVGLSVAVAGYAISDIEKNKKDDIYKELEIFSYVLSTVQAEYVSEVTSKDLIYGAMKGMLGALDPHSQFMDPDAYAELKVETTGKFGGLGIEITIKDGMLTIITPIEDTPAWKIGLKAGDRIVKIEDEVTRDYSLMDAVKKLRGKPGTDVNITVLREAEGKLLNFKITRDIIKIKDIKEAKVLEDSIGYIRLIEFRENTGKSMAKALSDLEKEGATALILDLRNNPGGLLDAAVKVTEKFIEEGKVVVSTKGRKALQNITFKAKTKNPNLDWPVVILINEGSASASEIVAGAIQDYRRGLILGIKSFGKGSVQTVIPLSDGSALRLTTSEYFTPSEKNINGIGITPDVEVKQQLVELKDTPGIEEIFEEIKEGKVPSEEETPEADYKKDYQLVRAIDLLKGIRIYNQKESE